MESKLDAGVQARLRAAERRGKSEEISVIITVRPPVSLPSLQKSGLHVSHVLETLHVVSGRAHTSRLAEIAALEEVLRIELDGEVRALPADGGGPRD